MKGNDIILSIPCFGSFWFDWQTLLLKKSNQHKKKADAVVKSKENGSSYVICLDQGILKQNENCDYELFCQK